MSAPPISTPDFFLIRHGETDWNRAGRLQGQHDIPLNPVGRDQATGAGQALRMLLRRRGLDARDLRFTASPLGRARDTMQRVRAVLGLPVGDYAIDPRLQELSFGAWEGRTWGELKLEAPVEVRQRKRDKWGFTPPQGESYADLARRVRPWLDAVTPDEVVVAHGGVARVLLQARGHIDTTAAPDLDIVQGRVLWFHGDRWLWV